MNDLSSTPATGADARPGAHRKRLSILGATGSIGSSTLDLITRDPQAYEIVALTANGNVEALAAAARAVSAECAVIADESLYGDLKRRLDGTTVEAMCGEAGLIEAGARPADIVVAAIMGFAGLKPTLAAVDRGTTVALANKECLVAAGDVFMDRARSRGARILPVDSEHNAIYQAIGGSALDTVAEITLTASGGPFRTMSYEDMHAVRPQQALKHPNWSMGAKITIDSATLMNKGLELIEAAHLFPVGADRLGAVVHPQSIVHGLVRFEDGSVIAQLGPPDMRAPLSYCLNWPMRAATPCERLDLAAIGALTFEPVDQGRFPAFKLALAALESGGAMPVVLNAANEVAVAAFLKERIRFTSIAAVVGDVMDAAVTAGMTGAPGAVDDVFALDSWSRARCDELVSKH